MQWKLWVGIGMSVAMLALALRGVDVAEVGHALADVRLIWLVPIVASIFIRFWLTAVRWKILLAPAKDVGLHRLFGVVMIGFMANNVLPFRIGEFVRAYALGRAETLPASLSFATIVVERIFDGFTLLLMLLGGLLFLELPPLLLWLALGSFCLYLGVLVVLLSLRHARGASLAARLVARLPGRLRDPLDHLLASFRLGLDALGNARAVLITTALSLAIWVVNALGMQATFAAFSLDLPLHAGFLVLAIVAGILVLPSAPGYVGTMQYGTVLAMGLYAVPKEVALSLSLLYHAVNYVPITLIGLVYLGAMNLTLGELRAAGEKATP
jgi:uncharacterized protein (TIRG00374 family)